MQESGGVQAVVSCHAALISQHHANQPQMSEEPERAFKLQLHSWWLLIQHLLIFSIFFNLSLVYRVIHLSTNIVIQMFELLLARWNIQLKVWIPSYMFDVQICQGKQSTRSYLCLLASSYKCMMVFLTKCMII